MINESLFVTLSKIWT